MNKNDDFFNQKGARHKRLFWTIGIIMTCVIVSGLLIWMSISKRENQDSNSVIVKTIKSESKCPIKEGTTKIAYHHHTNSGMAIYTTVEIFPDHLVWRYSEARNGCHLKDECHYDKEDFDKLVKELSTIQFSTRDLEDYSVGGAGYSYSFHLNSERYLYFNNLYQLSGDYDQVEDLIQQFIKSHKTKCEILFEKLAKEPHEKGHFGVFRDLPRELQKYKVK